MAEPYSGPKLEDLRQNLTDLIAKGLVPYNIAEKGGSLLSLRIVTSKLQLEDDADEDESDAAYATALVAVLNEAVTKKRMRTRRYRRTLRYVLGLKEEYLGRTVAERRIAAGENIKDEGEDPVKPDTIRTYYEPRAVNELAGVLVKMEAKHRGESPPVDAA